MCALVTGVQTCALPIWLPERGVGGADFEGDAFGLDHQPIDALKRPGALAERRIVEALKVFRHVLQHGRLVLMRLDLVRSEESRVGKECVSTCRSRWSPYKSQTHHSSLILIKNNI